MKLHELEDVKHLYQKCIVCGEGITYGYYGRWLVNGTEGGTCSKKCEALQEAKPKYERKNDDVSSLWGGNKP